MSGADTQAQTHVFPHTHRLTVRQAKAPFEWKGLNNASERNDRTKVLSTI